MSDNHLQKFLEENAEMLKKSLSADPQERLNAAVINAIELEKSKGFDPKTEIISVEIIPGKNSVQITATKKKKKS